LALLRVWNDIRTPAGPRAGDAAKKRCRSGRRGG